MSIHGLVENIMSGKKILIICTTDSMIFNFLIPHIKSLQDDGNIVECACSKTGFYIDELREQWGLIVHEIGFSRSPYRISNILCLVELKRLIETQKYDIIHCHEPVGGVMGRIAGKLCKKKVFYTAHGFHFFNDAPIKHWLIYFSAEKILSRLTDVLITICKEDFENSKKLSSKRRYYIHGIGVNYKRIDIVNIDKDAYRNEFNLNSEDKLIISVGEMIKRKNHAVVIKTISEIGDKRLKYMICGDGELESELKKMSSKLGVIDQVIFTGFRRDVGKLLSIADIFIFPSLWEGLGMAGLEAMYAGVPIIASNRQGIKDYVIDKETGLLFDPSDVNSLKQSIKFILENKQEVLRMRSNAHCILSQFSIENVIIEMRNIYKQETKF